jgi:hypothetical protein
MRYAVEKERVVSKRGRLRGSCVCRCYDRHRLLVGRKYRFGCRIGRVVLWFEGREDDVGVS